MSTAKELFDLMHAKFADIARRRDEFNNKMDLERYEASKMRVAISAVCKHEDGEEFIPNHDYHNDVDRSYYRCAVCGERLRDA